GRERYITYIIRHYATGTARSRARSADAGFPCAQGRFLETCGASPIGCVGAAAHGTSIAFCERPNSGRQPRGSPITQPSELKMKRLLLLGALLAGGSLCLQDISAGHGGTYRGPGDTVPPG